jgi:hypothetical protein
VYEAEDVQRLGLMTVGELPRFGGDNRGTLEERLAAERRQRRERERQQRDEERRRHERERQARRAEARERRDGHGPDGDDNG